MNDVRLALRTLGKSPSFTIVAVLSLALGTGANTAIFSLIDAVMLRMLPVARPEQLVFVDTRSVQMGSVRISEDISAASLEYLAQHASSVSSIAGAEVNRKTAIAVDGPAERATAHFVSPAYYSTLGVQPFIGRTLLATDFGPDARIAILSYGYWQRRFGGDSKVLGRQIAINGVPFKVAGITPREFFGLTGDNPADITVPFATLQQVNEGKVSSDLPKPDASAGMVVARLKDGISSAQAATELTGLLRQAILSTSGDKPNTQRLETISKLTVELTPASQGLSNTRNRFSEPLKVLMAVVALVMLIACANIANLLLAKSSGREREIAIRLSLGSSRWRLMRQLLTESVLLAAGGGALGLAFAVWARGAIIRAAAVPEAAFQRNTRVLAFTVGISLLNAILFGIMPALRATGIDLIPALKKGGNGRTHSRFGLGRALIAGQVALSMALLAGAGLFLETFRNLDSVELGYARKDALLITVDPHAAGYRGPRVSQFYQQTAERIAAVPGVRSVSQMSDRLMSGYMTMSSIFVPGYTPQNGEDLQNLWVISNNVGPGFLKTSGMQLVAGRDFNERDNESAPKIAVINETMARHFFGTTDAVGKRVSAGKGEPAIEIAGVVKDLKYFGVREDKQDVMFTPSRQYANASGQATLLVRIATPPASTVPGIRNAIASIDPAVPVYDVITIDQEVEASLAIQKLLALLSTFFAALAMGLAAIGLYGVLSSSVAQRTGEIGVRMALGAQPGSVLRLILSETARLVFIGVILGLGLAIAGGRLVSSMLFGVTATDSTSLTGAAATILITVALIAAFLPARRASKVDPMVALRHE